MIQLMLGLLAVAGTRHDPTWLDAIGLTYIQFQHESPHEAHYFKNHANEASAYVQFIYDYYDCLPKVRSWPSKCHQKKSPTPGIADSPPSTAAYYYYISLTPNTCVRMTSCIPTH